MRGSALVVDSGINCVRHATELVGECGEVFAPLTRGDQCIFKLRHQRGGGDGDAELLRKVNGNAEILAVQRNLEAEWVAILRHTLPAVLQEPTTLRRRQ